MWTLRSAAASPFVRKVKIAAAVAGLADRIEAQTVDTGDAASPLRRENPLGKIPALVLEDGTALYDSRVIAEFLDMEAGGALIPKGRERIAVLTLQALCDGICDAAVLRVYEERWRTPETRNAGWQAHQSGKIDRALDLLEAAPPTLSSNKPNIGQIALACALGYLDLRAGGEWRKSRPKLVAWLDAFAAKVPSFAETKPA